MTSKPKETHYQLTVLVDLRAPDLITAVETVARRIESVGLRFGGFADGADLDNDTDYYGDQLEALLDNKGAP